MLYKTANKLPLALVKNLNIVEIKFKYAFKNRTFQIYNLLIKKATLRE
jgi:hypothetical protein